MSTSIKVFSAGMPPDSLWVEPIGTWTDIITGRRSADGLFIRAEDALRLINKEVDAWWKKGGSLTQGHEWCGSEGGTPRRLGRDGHPIPVHPGSESGQPKEHLNALEEAELLHRQKEQAEDDESDFERRERIAEGIGDRKLDQQKDKPTSYEY